MCTIKSVSYFGINISLTPGLKDLIESLGMLSDKNDTNFSEKRKRHNEMYDRDIKIIDGELVTSIRLKKASVKNKLVS